MQNFRKFTNASSSGNAAGVSGPGAGTSTDNAIARWDGTDGRLIQNSTVIVSDAGSITMPDGANLTNVDYLRAGSSTSQKVALNRGTGTGSLGLALASDRSIGISSGASSESGFDVELIRTAANVWRLGDGASGFSWLQTAGFKRKTADQTVTNSTTFVDDTHLTVSLAAGRSYGFKFTLYVTTVATSGIQVALGGTATHTDLISDIRIYDHSVTADSTSVLTDSTTVGNHTAGSTGAGPVTVNISGTTTINAAGTFLVQFAQTAETGAAETVTLLRGSTLEVWDIA